MRILLSNYIILSKYISRAAYGLLISGACLFAVSLQAYELRVNIENIGSTDGFVGCAIYSQEEGFPKDSKQALAVVRQPANPEGVTCSFKDLQPGMYAIAAAHDANNNHKTDMNAFGIPKERWGVSNNARPSFRAPKFDEAKFELTSDMAIQVELKK